MRENVYKWTAIKRLTFSLLIVSIYILGSNLAFPGISTQFYINLLHNSPGLSLAFGATGLSLEHISLFTIGLSPWMSTLILWQVLSVTKIITSENLTIAQSYRIKFILCLFLGIIQSLGILSQVSFIDNHSTTYVVSIVLILIAGMCIIIWLGNMNVQYGVGGSTLLIMINIIKNLSHSIVNTHILTLFYSENIFVKVATLFFIFFILFIIFRFFQGERRLPLVHVMLDGKYASQSYLPISINLAGGMPFIYAFSIMLFPQYIVSLMGQLIDTKDLYNQLLIDHALGGTLLIVIIILLTYGFSYINIDYKTLADNFKKSGDYFVNVYPGKNTERYIFHRTTEVATVVAIFNSLTIGLPLVFAGLMNQKTDVVYLIPTIIMIMLLMQGICTQFHQAYYRNSYQTFLKD
ncbi:accessory Sec system protein translocase subunit SecY2 [Lactococcus lactis]|uniref:accessory Sec system protein translocase subunit SecY2 n=1 Tax=Lactococcus lactis TaxID=1358 RepID=UPI00111E0D95|nr:accessory Sec system protein translocase subunit SecY2 [Lactococcus lactis]TNU77507.1 accessory Sec system protein translocase subunit SecY2 [Lactococcus lactis subsp. lactis]